MITIETFNCGPMGANCYIVGDDADGKAFMVDPGGPNGRMERYIEENHLEIQYILLTHGHGDHIGGVKHYKTLYPQAKVIACELERGLLTDPGKNFSKTTAGQEIVLEADIYVNDGDTLNVGNMELFFLGTPGHTPGGLSIYLPATKCVFSGDTLFAQSVGRTDLGGSQTKLFQSIKEKLYALPDDTEVYPGHMGKTAIKIEKEYNPFV